MMPGHLALAPAVPLAGGPCLQTRLPQAWLGVIVYIYISSSECTGRKSGTSERLGSQTFLTQETVNVVGGVTMVDKERKVAALTEIAVS